MKNTDSIDMLSVFLYLFLRCETKQRVITPAGAVYGNAQGCSLSAPAHGRDADDTDQTAGPDPAAVVNGGELRKTDIILFLSAAFIGSSYQSLCVNTHSR